MVWGGEKAGQLACLLAYSPGSIEWTRPPIIELRLSGGIVTAAAAAAAAVTAQGAPVKVTLPKAGQLDDAAQSRCSLQFENKFVNFLELQIDRLVPTKGYFVKI
jgi:hypothetical protein